jgi:hypothetical protein
MNCMELVWLLGVYSGIKYQKEQTVSFVNMKIITDLINGYISAAGYHNNKFTISDYMNIFDAFNDYQVNKQEKNEKPLAENN